MDALRQSPKIAIHQLTYTLTHPPPHPTTHSLCSRTQSISHSQKRRDEQAVETGDFERAYVISGLPA